MNKDMNNNSKIRQHKILNRPILGASILIIYGTAFYQILASFGGASKSLSYLLGALGGILLLVIHKFWFKGEFKGCVSFDFLKDKSYLMILGIFIVVDVIAAGLTYSQVGFAAPTIEGISMTLMAAFAEEATWRVLPCSVIMRRYKEKNNYMVALLFSAIIFGMIHFLNIIAGAQLSDTAIQVISALSAGFFMGALYIRTGSVVPGIAIHFINNMISGMVGAGECGVAFSIFMNSLVIITNVVLAIILLKGKKQEIIETWNNIWISQPEQETCEETTV